MNTSPLNNNSTPETVVGESLKVEGELKSQGDLRIDGQVTGSIITEGSIIIGDKAKIKADITAANADIAGEVIGDLFIKNKTSLKATANITGKIETNSFAVEEGADFNGECSMSDPKKDNASKKIELKTPDHLELKDTINT